MHRGKEDRVNELRSGYEAIQKKTFTKWANSYVKDRHLEVNDLYKDLADGKVLMALLEKLSGDTLVCVYFAD